MSRVPVRRAASRLRALALPAGLALAAPPLALAAQHYDPATGAPSSLLAVPEDGVAYHGMRLLARSLVAEGKLAEAEPLVERIARAYPRDGENWAQLARVKAMLKKPEEAAAAYERVGALLGWRVWPHLPGYNAAGMRLAGGDARAALATLDSAVFARRGMYRADVWGWRTFESLHGDTAFRRIVGRPDTTSWGAAEGRRRDVDHLVAEVRRVNPVYHDAPLPAEFLRRADALRRDAPAMSMEEFVVGLNRMLAALHQAHTELLGGMPVHHLPLQFHLFPEGLYVVRATPEYQALVGARVLAFERTPAEEALRRVNLMQSVDGDMQYLWTGAFLLRNGAYLHGSGVVTRVDSVELTVAGRDGRRRAVRISTAADVEGWQKLPAPPVATLPLWMSRADRTYWEHPLPERDAMYVQVNQMRNDSAETLPAFGRRLWAVLEARTPRHLILDLRQNNGGVTSLYAELLRTLVAYTRTPGRDVYVLIGRNTFSATANFLMDLERLVSPVFVGEASSECCRFHGDPVNVRLPYTGLSGAITAVQWNLSGDPADDRREISPHVPVQLTAKAYFAGEDPALAAVYRLIDGARAPAQVGAPPR